MNITVSVKELRTTLPSLMKKVKKGARITVLYRSRPVFQIVPVDDAPNPSVSDLASDPIYKAPALGRSKDGLTAADHDAVLYR